MKNVLAYGRFLFPVFCLSFAVIGWQLALMRALLVARYHHFSFLVISCALLGFGAGGTALALWRERLVRSRDTVWLWGLLFFACSLPVCFRLGEALALNVYFPPALLSRTILSWSLFWLIHLVPFFLAGLLIGLLLATETETVHVVYSVNLAGSAMGALGAIGLMWLVPAHGLAMPLGAVVLVSALVLIPESVRTGRIAFAIVSVVVLFAGVAIWLKPLAETFPLRIDQYKTLAFVQRLIDQGDARIDKTLHGPRGRIDLAVSPHFHSLLSLGVKAVPPRLDMVLRDGLQAGAILRGRGATAAAPLDGTLAALPYHLSTPQRVLILGEPGSLYLRLALLHGAQRIVLVQPDGNVLSILREHPSKPLSDARIRVVEAQPRAFLDATGERYDLIQMAALEGFTPGSSGVGGLRENYLATVQGFGKCLQALRQGGMATVLRGIQDPARDTIKIAGTWIEALEQRGVSHPGRCLLLARDELNILTIASSSSLSRARVRRFQEVCRARSLETEWFPGIRPEQSNRLHILPGPEGTGISWYHYALRRLLSPGREAFYQSWICDVRPATDNQPFFFDFFRWEALERLQEAFGPMWPARAEMGFLMLIVAAGWTALIAALLIPAPLLVKRVEWRPTQGGLLAVVFTYFGALGMGFMFVEMSMIQMFTRLLGDPVFAAALVVGGLLFFAGIGSMMQPRIVTTGRRKLFPFTVVLAAAIIAAALALPLFFELAGLFPFWHKAVTGLAVIGFLGFLMGQPFPWGLAMVNRIAPQAVPLAWAINGYLSVVCTSLAVILAMTWGFRVLIGAAAVSYLTAGLLSAGFETGSQPPGTGDKGVVGGGSESRGPVHDKN